MTEASSEWESQRRSYEERAEHIHRMVIEKLRLDSPMNANTYRLRYTQYFEALWEERADRPA